MLDVFKELATEAGILIRDFYENGDYKTEFKGDKSPVTTADYKANELIVEGLKDSMPQIPVISEELSFDDTNKTDFFLVDPLDGTKEFLKGTGQFTVNIAYIKNKKPLIGVIYSPISGDMFFCDEEKRAFRENKLKNVRKILINVQEEKSPKVPVRIVTSRDHLDSETQRSLKSLENYETVKMGSSIKFCLLAEGKAQIYPRKMPTMEWDTAAGHAILNASGGSVVDLTTKRELVYGKKNYKNNSFVAYSCSRNLFNSLKGFLKLD